ncbi:MAG TPA: PAS domain-containing sensor histidine kinase [Candidatus Thermoplasmatota archaeon]|nr:PAS domain-containing sensor histidine kinase [Candidatus Thermoplasmatota archaeon]
MGATLSDEQWGFRHRAILLILAAHAAGLTVFALWMQVPWDHALFEGGVILLFVAGALWPFPRWVRSSIASAGLISSSAVLTHLSGGYIEAHFHFFVMLSVILLYEDWRTYGLAIGYVFVHHGIVGTLDPTSVYNHPAALAAPWLWAGIHATFVMGHAAANLWIWRVAERARMNQAQIVESAGEAILGIDGKGRITFANPAAAALTGMPADKLLSRPLADFAPVPVAIQRGSAEGALRRADGTSLPVEWTCAPLGGPATRDRVVTIRDASERKRAQEAERRRELEALKVRFLNQAAHELRTPITPIRLQIDLLRDGHADTLTERQRRALSILDRNVARLQRLAEDLLDVARLQSDEFSLRREPTDLGIVASMALESFEASAQSAGVTLRFRCEGPLPVHADPARLTQVLYNLLANALRATPPGGEVTVAATRRGTEAELSVADTGRGLSPEDASRLFQPFARLESSSGESGTGLGLYICRRIVERHGGTIACRSEGLGRGAVFAFALPLAAKEAPPQAPPRPPLTPLHANAPQA